MPNDSLIVAGRVLPLPCFFPSVSSIKTNSAPLDYIRFLNAAEEQLFLVSAYDIALCPPNQLSFFLEALADAARRGATVLVDSGNYETFWKGDQTWTAKRLGELLSNTTAHLAFCFDDQSPPSDPGAAAAAIVSAVQREQGSMPSASVCPIVHGKGDALIEATRQVAATIQPLLLAVAERELGDGIIARASTIRRLRTVLDQVAPKTALHVLGTGNPLALLTYSIVGAQSFDGLEWCQTCVDPDAAHLHHFQHRDLVRRLDPPLNSTLPYVEGTLLHNLLFYRSWMQKLRFHLRTGQAISLLETHLPAARKEATVATIAELSTSTGF